MFFTSLNVQRDNIEIGIETHIKYLQMFCPILTKIIGRRLFSTANFKFHNNSFSGWVTSLIQKDGQATADGVVGIETGIRAGGSGAEMRQA